MAARHDASPDALIAAHQREAVKPGRQKLSGRGSGLTPKVRKAIEILISADDLNPSNMNGDAAERAGISGRALKAALQKPSVRRFMNEQIEIYREGLKAVAVRTIGDVMTDPTLKSTAAGARVRLEAAKTVLIDNLGSSTNLHVNTQINVTPGYVVDLTAETEAAPVLEKTSAELNATNESSGRSSRGGPMSRERFISEVEEPERYQLFVAPAT